MIKNIIRTVVFSLAALTILVSLPVNKAYGQDVDESFRIKTESVLHRFTNYRFSKISLFKVKDVGQLRKAIQSKERSEKMDAGTEEQEKILNSATQAAKQIISTGIDQGFSKGKIQRNFFQRGEPIPENFDQVYSIIESQKSGSVKVLRNGYLITNRMSAKEDIPEVIIGLIINYEDEETLKKNIDRPSAKNIYTYDEMKNFELPKDEFGAANMYELMMTSFRQNNVDNITGQAQGIGTFMRFFPKQAGVSRSLIQNPYEVTPEEVQSFKRISEGNPLDYNLKKNEVIVSPDMISWTRYDIKTEEWSGGIDTISTITNRGLPKFGVEARYGLDDINYPSLWSERMTLSAVWQNVKFGAVLPTHGWASLSEDLYNQNRSFTVGGVGIAGQADFPVLVIPKSGIFHVSGSYIFGDAAKAEYKDNDINNIDIIARRDYMVRAHGQLHYTFGISVDSDYLLRLGMGATAYNAETWAFEKQEGEEEEVDFNKVNDETVGGFSGKLEFMSKSAITPYGGSLQYFDEALMMNIWLQIPIIENTFSIRLDAKGFFAAFRDNLNPWEEKSIFTPTARFVVIF